MNRVTPLLLLALPSIALAQGADDCTMATPITGAGPHNFDNSAATIDGVPDPLCTFFGFDDIENDVWFAWTAGMSASHTLSVCASGSTVDTKIAILDGSCGGAVLACNDDSCALQTEVTFNATAGSVYYVRLGTYPGATGGIGAFDINPNIPMQNPANGHYYMLVNEQLSWTDANTAAQSMIWQGQAGHLVTINDTAEEAWIVANMPGRGWTGLFQNLNSPSYAEPAGGWEWVTGEPVGTINWFPGEPNDTSASAGAEDYAEIFGNGQLNDAELFHAQTQAYYVEWGGTVVIGSNYCMANPNSAGMPARMQASGSAIVANNDLVLECVDMPNNKFGYFLNSLQQGFVMNPGGSEGNLCVIGQIGRFNRNASEILNSGSTGEISLAVDLDDIPTPTGPVSILSGETWNFTAWYRDNNPTSTSNFADGLEITFL